MLLDIFYLFLLFNIDYIQMIDKFQLGPMNKSYANNVKYYTDIAMIYFSK